MFETIFAAAAIGIAMWWAYWGPMWKVTFWRVVR
jgi:hypothetical protein